MDEEGTIELPVRGGKHFKTVSMGSHIVNYDSMIVLTHFKGHAMGGFGGSMKISPSAVRMDASARARSMASM